MKLKKNSRVFIGIGSNIENRVNNILRSINNLKKNKNIKINNISSFYLTEPEGEKITRPFVNCVLEIKTNLVPTKLLELLESIERKMGRKKKGTNEDRIIDLDILFYENKKILTPKLIIPHQKAHLRRFVLTPLAEIAPDFVHPVYHKKIFALKEKLTDNSVLIRLGRVTTI